MAYGYIYKTVIHNENSKLNNHYYIGQHKYDQDHLDSRYYGSGTILKDYIKKNGVTLLTCEILEWANSAEELNELEAQYVNEEVLKDSLCINFVVGGGSNNYFENMDEETKQKVKDKISKSVAKLWEEDLEYREHMEQILRDNARNPLRIEKFVKSLKKYYDEHPEAREAVSERTKQQRQDPITKQHLLDSKKDPDYIKQISESSKKRWENPEERKNVSEKLQKYYEDDTHRDELSKRIKDACGTEEFKQKLSIKTSERYKNPEARKATSDSVKGLVWYNNGIIQARFKENDFNIPEGWVRGLLYKKYPDDWKWYNNGKINVRYKECPEGFKRGFLKKKYRQE